MRTKATEHIAIIILAAGGSVRLGQPKQLLIYQNQSLLQRAINSAREVPDTKTFVVTGAQGAQIKKLLDAPDIMFIENDDWQAGLATSIVTGLSAALAMDAAPGGCIFTVCDQPHLNATLLQKMITVHLETGKGIVAAAYGGTRGTPVFFAPRYFAELLQLQAEEGARKVIGRHEAAVATVAFENGEIDIDTMNDYQRLCDAEG